MFYVAFLACMCAFLQQQGVEPSASSQVRWGSDGACNSHCRGSSQVVHEPLDSHQAVSVREGRRLQSLPSGAYPFQCLDDSCLLYPRGIAITAVHLQPRLPFTKTVNATAEVGASRHFQASAAFLEFRTLKWSFEIELKFEFEFELDSMLCSLET
jgi:hypothetical protein